VAVDFSGVWKNLWSFRDRAKRRKNEIPRVLSPDVQVGGEEQIHLARKQADYWSRVKELSNHQEALESTIQPEVVASINRLFSPTAAPHEVNFDRGVLYTFFMMTDKMAKADSELIKAQARITALEKEYKYAAD